MSEMIERVAEALTKEFEPYRVFNDGEAERLARAAIEAMREPTEAMGGPDVQAACGEPASGVGYIWRRLIDATLAE